MSHLTGYLYASAIGVLVGLERQRSHHGLAGRVYGVRTFALIALVGSLATAAGDVVAGVALAGVIALLVLAYRRTSETDPGTTTEVAAVATFLLGGLCYRDSTLAAALGIGVVALLMNKARLHHFVSDELSDVEVEDAVKFLIGAFVILPLLPRRGVGPYAILNPSRIWLLVVVLTGISWVGYIAVRALGPRRGPLAAGFASGFVSATAATASMARLAHVPSRFQSAVAGARIASAATYLELVIIVAVASPTLSVRLALPALGGTISLGLVSYLGVRSETTDDAPLTDVTKRRVVTLTPAIVLAVILTGALLLARWGASDFGSRGAVAAVALAGLADAHGGSLTAATLLAKGTLDLRGALVAVGAALTANTLVKCAIAFVAGGRQFGRGVSVGVLESHAIFLAGLAAVFALS